MTTYSHRGTYRAFLVAWTLVRVVPLVTFIAMGLLLPISLLANWSIRVSAETLWPFAVVLAAAPFIFIPFLRCDSCGRRPFQCHANVRGPTSTSWTGFDIPRENSAQALLAWALPWQLRRQVFFCPHCKTMFTLRRERVG